MSQKSTLQELEDIFNMIPKDGSNIKDTEEDDDNGYASLDGDTSLPFEAKAAELAAKVAVSPSSPELPRKAEPTPEPTAPVTPPVVSGDDLEATLVDAVNETPPPSTGQFDHLDGVTMADIVVPGYPKPIVDQTPIPDYAAIEPKGISYASLGTKQIAVDELPQGDLPRYDRDVAAVAHIIPRGNLPSSITEGEEVLVPAEDKTTPVVIPETSILSPRVPETALAKVEEKVPDTLIQATVTVDKESISNSESAPANTVAESNSLEPEEADADGWLLTTKVKQFEEFYVNKRWALKRLLPDGRLPFTRWGRELAESKAIVECSYDTTAMFEQMKYIQSHKVRVTEIIQQLNSQYFKWKRFMAILRADAARMEGAKVAQSDAAAMRHLRDFEDYFGDLEALMETAEHVIKNLESGWDTLNRGVTIVLQAHGHERGMTRYEPQGYVPPSRPLPQQPQQDMKSVRDLDGFDSLDATPAAPETPKKKGSDSWDVVEDWGQKKPRR